MRLRKSNNLLGNEVLVPMAEQKVPEVTEEKPIKPKRIVVRKKKNVDNT